MILDSGICSVYEQSDRAEGGRKPVRELWLKAQSWYGELNFETTPVFETATREDVEVSARIRILQNRAVSNLDRVVLSGNVPPKPGEVVYSIVRAYHGIDKDNGQPVTDLSLQKVVR